MSSLREDAEAVLRAEGPLRARLGAELAERVIETADAGIMLSELLGRQAPLCSLCKLPLDDAAIEHRRMTSLGRPGEGEIVCVWTKCRHEVMTGATSCDCAELPSCTLEQMTT